MSWIVATADGASGASRTTGTPETGPDASVPTASNNVGGSVAVVAAAIAADRRRRRQQLGGRNLPSLPVLPPRSRGPIRAPEPPPPYWAHYAHRPVPAASAAPTIARIGGAVSAGGGGGGGGVGCSGVAAAAAAAAPRHNSASTTDDSDTSNDIPRTHRGRSTSGESSSIGGAAGHSGGTGFHAAQQHGTNEPNATDAQHRYNLRNQQRQRIKEHLLSQDAFCPDLVRNCKNIANASPERQSSPVPGGEYAEVGELSRSLAAVAINVGASTSAGRSSTTLGAENAGDKGKTPILQPLTSDASGPSASDVPVTMGQNLSIRRPKISLTWVLREQSREGSTTAVSGSSQQQSQQALQHSTVVSSTVGKTAPIKGPSADKTNQSTPRVSPTEQQMTVPTAAVVGPSTGSGQSVPVANGVHNHHHHHVIVRKKSRTRSKERLFSEKYVSDNNLSEYHSDKLRSHANDYTTAPSVVGSTAPVQTTTGASAGSNLYRKSNRKNSDRLKKKERLLLYPNGLAVDANGHHNNNNSQHAINLNKEPAYGEGLKEKIAVALKNTCSEPSLYTTVSEPSASTKHRHHRHHHRRRRERYRSQRFGYEINNVDEFLSKCSLSSPGNIPVVLSSAATLYQTRPGSYQIEIPLPLGMVVNAVFKNQNWLYVQTPHAEEGYVAYDTCLPLGILPSNQRSTSSSKPTPCWESNKDVFPKPCGNLTDSEKEIQQLRGGTRSEGRRTPRLKRSSANSRSAASITACNSERDLDSLYLRTVASNQPKSTDGQTQYAQLKLTTKVLGTVAPSVKSEKALAIEQLEKLICSGSGDYVHLLKQRQQHLLAKQQHYLAQLRQQQQQQQQQACKIELGTQGNQIISGSNHLRISLGGTVGMTNVSNGPFTVCSSAAAVRQTLLAITENYCSEAVSVHKGDVVTLLACKEYQEKGLKNYKQWFFVRTRDGHEGYIPAEAAGHGFL
ncbi:AGAP006034-PA-like protein [Anopheles sinensis]|uniref:AGAP006034-PA-like protein n=1 Tax=Anopheles sinensis TaxID=74873 RepID=A0A084W423_ANOSI|nr:AGAP006034-PA-like protein [Anopheles sinensis]